MNKTYPDLSTCFDSVAHGKKDPTGLMHYIQPMFIVKFTSTRKIACFVVNNKGIPKFLL